MHNNDNVDLDVQSVKLGEGKLDNTFKVAHLTGTFKFSLSPGSPRRNQKIRAGRRNPDRRCLRRQR